MKDKTLVNNAAFSVASAAAEESSKFAPTGLLDSGIRII